MDFIKVKLKVNEKIVKESLNRMGIASRKSKILYPSCYLLTIKGEHYIAHFKQLFKFKNEDGYDNISDDDINRMNAIIFCLKNWGLLDVDDELITPHDIYVFVLSHKEKDDWRIVHKINSYTVESLNDLIKI